MVATCSVFRTISSPALFGLFISCSGSAPRRSWWHLAMTVRQPVLDAHPKPADVFDPIAAELTSDEMR